MAKQTLRHAALLIVGAVLVAAFTATKAHAQQPPPVPHAFYGAVEVYGQPAAVGAQIEARGAGVKVGILGNPLSVTVAGRYGGPTFGEPKLGVQGKITDSTPIEFYVDGMKAECARPDGPWQSSYPFSSGVVTLLNLRVSQSATPTATPTSTSIPAAISASPTPSATNTPEPTWTTAPATPTPGASNTPQPTRTAEPATPTVGAAIQNAVRATRTPRSTTPTPVGATGAALVTPMSQDTPPALPSVTPIRAGSAAIALATPTPTGSAAGKEAIANAQASPASASGNLARAIVPTGAPGVAATPEPPKSGGDVSAPANAAQPVSTRPTAMLVARVTAAPHGASAPILGSSAIADAVPAASTADASPWSLSSILPWAGAALLLLAFGLVGIVVVLRPGKSGRNGRNTGGQP